MSAVSSTMPAVHPLRDFIRERLTAAAEEIFTEVEKTIVRYEEDIRLLGVYWKPRIKLTRIEPEPPRVKQEPEPGRIGENLQEPDVLQVKDEEPEFGETVVWYQEENRLLDVCWNPELTRTDVQQPHVSIKEEASSVQQRRRSSDDQEEPEPAWIKEEEEEPELFPARRDQNFVHQQSTGVMETSTPQEGHLSKDVNTEQLSSRKSPDVRRKDQAGSSSTVSQHRSHSDKKKRPFQCDVCGKCYSLKSSLSRHQIVHTGERPFPCELCGKLFTQGYSLAEHKETHKGVKPFECKICKKAFFRFRALRAHEKIHSSEKPFSCQKCGRRFVHHWQLDSHRRVHTSDRPFPCLFCGKPFLKRSHLAAHHRIHTGERPFSCVFCGKRFLRRGHLTVHHRIHTGERPFTCKMCGKSFIENTKLTAHMKKIHKSEHEVLQNKSSH